MTANPNPAHVDRGSMNIPTAPLPDLNTVIKAYLLGYEIGQADAILGFFNAESLVAEDFVAHLPTDKHTTETLATYFLNGYAQGYDEMSDEMKEGVANG